MMPWTSCWTVGRSEVLRNIVEPPIAWARSDTANRVSRVTRPSLSASNSMLSVINFDIEAGGSGVSAFFSSSTVLVVRS